MKKLFPVVAILMLLTTNSTYAQWGSLGDRIGTDLSNKAQNKVENEAENAADKAYDKSKDAAVNGAKKNNKSNSSNSNGSSSSSSGNSGTQQASTNKTSSNDDGSQNTSSSTPSTPVVIKAYQNYDFIPGNKVIFADDFVTDMDGEFPTHWNLDNGQGVINNNVGGRKAFLLTDGNYAWVTPLMKTKKYLGTDWTAEFDTWRKAEAYQIIVFLQDENKSDLGKILINSDGVTVSFVDNDVNGKDLFGSYPGDMQNDPFMNKWHHVAIAYKNKQIKVYVDQVRAITVPNSNLAPAGLAIGGIGSNDGPLIFSNFRLAEGGNMNMLDKMFTDSKVFSTTGITFDVNKATIKPESMGVINQLFKYLQANTAVKMEVDGHTDSDGDAAANLKLSQQRADAVKTQLVSMGVDGSRFSTKGYGETKPISDNTTSEGKANNRRVEFVKM